MFDETTSLSVKIERKAEGAILVSLNGRIDSDTYRKLDKEIQPILVPATKVIILDMSRVGYVSSAGLAVIFQMKKFVEKKGGSFIIASLQPQVKRVFDVIKALPSENVFESQEEIDRYLDVIQRRELDKQKDNLG
ncbi:MAG: STAS domain-containing protein [Candidatus Omnitrophica bacterium]|nr:STAS domain-containing protein [Candidatus Omnitrophota bacterium]